MRHASGLLFVAVSSVSSVAMGGSMLGHSATLHGPRVDREQAVGHPGEAESVYLQLFASNPTLGELPSDGASTFFADPGMSASTPGYASWDFVWSVDVSETGRAITDFNIALQVGYQPADAGSPREQITVNLSQMLAAGGLVGVSDGSGLGSEVSVTDNLGVSRWSDLFGPAFNPSAAGTFDFLLSVDRTGQSSSYSTSMSVVSSVAVVPLPAAIWAGIALMSVVTARRVALHA